MRKIAILAAIVLSVVFIMAFSATAFAASPHTGYAGTTDYCISCHDMHEASGDYVLTRESTVTGVCGTCHGLFGNAAPAGVTWSGGAPADMVGANPTASTLLAYKVNMSALSGAQMDATPGHSLGVMYGGTVVRTSDTVPGGSATLKVMTSGQYGGFNNGLYGSEATSTFTGTKGLYCASCHTPHAESGQLIAGTKLLSALPNHTMGAAATDTIEFCISCHDKRDNVGVENNHPSTYCLTCHANTAGESDFPHTSSTQKLLQMEPDALCILCHTAGTLP